MGDVVSVVVCGVDDDDVDMVDEEFVFRVALYSLILATHCCFKSLSSGVLRWK